MTAKASHTASAWLRSACQTDRLMPSTTGPLPRKLGLCQAEA